MKKQLLIAAVAASMTSVAMADIAISGAAKMNSLDGVYSHEIDLTISGKSGDTSITANLAMDDKGEAAGTATNDIKIEDMYLTTEVSGVKLKMGGWRSGKNELRKTGGITERVNVSTSFGGLSLAYEDTGASNSTTIGGSLAGVSVSHKINQDTSTETKASGSMGGVNVSVHSKENADSETDTAITLTTEVQGITLTYVKITTDSDTDSDGYIVKGSIAKEADAIGIKTSIAGNTVQFKAKTVDGVDTNQVILTRALGAGATFEAQYIDTDDKAAAVDLELAVKF